ncbi:MAG TPA: ribonuclease H [Anaerolineae bacterium]|nr:ribonuclease H [Anaerolineae bacterium]
MDIFARACALGAPGPGGYAAILAYAHDSDRDVSGASRLATSNVMELRAVVAGLEALEQPSRVTLHTASKYVLEGATRWLAEWERRDWHAKDGKPVKNKEIWLELVRAMAGHDVVWEPLSERSDRHGQRAAKLARARAERMKLSQST